MSAVVAEVVPAPLNNVLGLPPAVTAVAMQAVGDSMAPTIDRGDLLIVDVTSPTIRGEGVYVFAVDGQLDATVVKRVGMIPTGGLVIFSDNPLYAHERDELFGEELAQLRVVGRVVWAGGRI